MVEPARSDFSERLARCRLSISQAGYNTVMDLLRAGCPALLVPFEGNGETEQRMRSERLQLAAGYPLLAEAELDGASLARAVEQALSHGPGEVAIDTDGAAQSARILKRLAAE
nr:glycosyltransferase [Motiliproteus sp. SC1-56]